MAEAGAVLVPGRLLADITRSLPGQPVDLATDGARVQLTCGTARSASSASKYCIPWKLKRLAMTEVGSRWIAVLKSRTLPL